MRYTDVKTFPYDPDLFASADVQVALRIHDEYVRRSSPKKPPTFFEVDRDTTQIDSLWHSPVDGRIQYTERSPIPVYCIATFVKPSWNPTKKAMTPSQRFKFWLSNIRLQQLDYFPARGDYVYYNGYRLFITQCSPAPEAYWQQSGVWLGITADAQIIPEGDRAPLDNVSEVVPAEQSKAAPGVYYPTLNGGLPFLGNTLPPPTV